MWRENKAFFDFRKMAYFRVKCRKMVFHRLSQFDEFFKFLNQLFAFLAYKFLIDALSSA